jgi:asparagine synthase (glutamine-hydrolysing)
MCGICGIIEKNPDQELIQNMIARLHHRGPDSGGYFADDDAALGHARLSIIDQAGSAQPLSNEDDRFWITFNGEIFNYLELREELIQLGHRFKTEGDTEVIVHSYEQWGEDCLLKFNGQWAFAIWDRKEKLLFFSRDRMGIRPFFFHSKGNRFSFASEIKSFLEDPRFQPQFSLEGLGETMQYWGPQAANTVFKEIQSLAPAHLGYWDGRTITTREYWSPDFSTIRDISFADAKHEFRELLYDAVKLRFERSDVPVGAYLSGGIDSSITASIVKEVSSKPIHSYSLRFDDPEYDEGKYQDLMSQRLGANHRYVMVSPGQIAESFPRAVYHAERPILRTAPAPMMLLSELVQQDGFRVVVTGEGSDEVLAGYDIFLEALTRSFVHRNPDSELRYNIYSQLYPWMKRSPAQSSALAKQFFKRMEPEAFSSHLPRWRNGRALFRLLNDPIDISDSPAMKEDFYLLDELSRAQLLEIRTLLAPYLLSAQGDRMLMANSIEGRFPFLDHRLVEFAAALPTRYKVNGLKSKFILGESFQDMLPEEIRNRPKQPYRAPDAESFFQKESIEYTEYLLSPELTKDAGLFKTQAAQVLLERGKKKMNEDGKKPSNQENMQVCFMLSSHILYEQFMKNPLNLSPGRKNYPKMNSSIQ